jgi:hypothetical protein
VTMGIPSIMTGTTNEKTTSSSSTRPTWRHQSRSTSSSRLSCIPSTSLSEASVQPCRQHNNDDEDVNGKLKFTIPKFLCTHDPKANLFWQQQVDRIFCVHNYNEKMVSMASIEFQEYESIWCEQVQVTHV